MSSFLQRILQRASRRALLISKRAMQSLRRPAGKQVVFVGGIQRSGTNMLMDVLERSVQTDVYHETDDAAFDAYELRSPEVLHRLVNNSPAPTVVLKALCELQDMRALITDFAPARAIWMLRNYDDMVNSHLRSWRGCPDRIARIITDRNSAGWRGRGMSDDTHALISRLHHPGINDASAVALFWYFRNILFFEQGFDHDKMVTVVRYETLVAEPDAEFARLFDFLGLDYSDFVSRKVFASSIRKNPPPDIEPPIRELCDALTARFESVISRYKRP